MANTIERFVDLDINNKTYKFGYTVKNLIFAEKRLDKKSILTMIAEAPLSFNDSYEMFTHGLMLAENKLDTDKLDDIFMAYMEEHNLGDLQALILEALMASGTIGKLQKNV